MPRRPRSSGEPVSTSAATFPRSSNFRSPRAITELQNSHTTTIEEPDLKAIGAPHAGQATSTLTGWPPRAWNLSLEAALRLKCGRASFQSHVQRFAQSLDSRTAEPATVPPRRTVDADGNSTN